ncbi:MAG: PepSY-like domain-containing protein [Bacteroidota bacterium]|jgi:hypothetical protein
MSTTKTYLIALAAAATLSLGACQNDLISRLTGQITEKEISLSDLPSAVVEFTNNHFPDADINSAFSLKNSKASTIVALSNGEQLAFDDEHNYLGEGDDFRPKKKHGKKGKHGDKKCDDCMEVDAIPAAVKEYVAANYPDYTLACAEKESNCVLGSSLEVKLKSASYDKIKLLFNESGAYMGSGTRIEYSSLPAAVSAYVQTNYSGYKTGHKVQKFISASGAVSYCIVVRNEDNKKKICLAEDGTFICED